MGLRKLFKKRERPSTEGLQSGEQKNMKSPEIVFPPVDEHGRFVPKSRSTNGKQ
ncbi:MAG: hypothetical protein FWC44_01745 [Methanomassiliicoccaceae archaeon]|nr:hypothetical protein [Methanomassiliicoccaceae archaeon]